MSTPPTTEAVLQELNTPERVEPPAPDPPPPAEPTPLNVEDDAAVQAALDANAIQVPDGDTLVPSSDVGKVGQAYRGQIKALKTELAATKEGSAKIPQLEQQIAHLTQTVQQLQPYVQAYQTAVQQQASVVPKEPEISEAEAEQYARTYDLYKADGSGQPDIDRGRKIVSDMRRIATEAADKAAAAHVQPLQHQSMQSQSAYMLARAKNTILPNGMKIDSGTLDQVWGRLDPSVTATVEGAQWATVTALGLSMGMAKPEQLQEIGQQAARPRGPDGKFLQAQAPPAAPIPDPVPREPSGGQLVQGQTSLSDQERKFLTATGMSEADYLKTASNRFGAR